MTSYPLKDMSLEQLPLWEQGGQSIHSEDRGGSEAPPFVKVQTSGQPVVMSS